MNRYKFNFENGCYMDGDDEISIKDVIIILNEDYMFDPYTYNPVERCIEEHNEPITIGEVLKLLNEDFEPSYYNDNGMSPNTAFKNGLISKEEYIGFCKGNVIKYVVRCDKKGDMIGDIDKAIDYLELLKNIFFIGGEK